MRSTGERAIVRLWPRPPERSRLDRARAGAGQEVAEDVVVDDDGRHSGCGQIRVVDFSYESTMVLGAESFREDLLAPPRRKKNHGIPQVDDRHVDPRDRAPSDVGLDAGTGLCPLVETSDRVETPMIAPCPLGDYPYYQAYDRGP